MDFVFNCFVYILCSNVSLMRPEAESTSVFTVASVPVSVSCC